MFGGIVVDACVLYYRSLPVSLDRKLSMGVELIDLAGQAVTESVGRLTTGM